jgi:hypothetical protein
MRVRLFYFSRQRFGRRWRWIFVKFVLIEQFGFSRSCYRLDRRRLFRLADRQRAFIRLR